MAVAATEDGGPVVGADAGASTPLGMNDVTILTPLPSEKSSPVLLRGADLADDKNAMIPRDLFDRLAEPTSALPVMTAEDYDRLHLVAVRFDLCDRAQPGPCAAGQDGRLRLVFQPFIGFLTFNGQPEFFDAALHAFYVIPEAQLAAAVTELRALAAMQGAPRDSALKPSPALSAPAKPGYAEALRKFVRARALKARFVRLAMNAQPVLNASIQWRMRSLEVKADGSAHDTAIAGSATALQEVVMIGGGLQVTPANDTPPGLAGVLSEDSFRAASAAQKWSMLEILVAVDNPLTHGLETASCVSCHASTLLLDRRAQEAGIDVESLSGAYTDTHNLSIGASRLPVFFRTPRALGYLNGEPMIARRVVHETAQVLNEIAQRYP